MKFQKIESCTLGTKSMCPARLLACLVPWFTSRQRAPLAGSRCCCFSSWQRRSAHVPSPRTPIVIKFYCRRTCAYSSRGDLQFLSFGGLPSDVKRPPKMSTTETPLPPALCTCAIPGFGALVGFRAVFVTKDETYRSRTQFSHTPHLDYSKTATNSLSLSLPLSYPFYCAAVVVVVVRNGPTHNKKVPGVLRGARGVLLREAQARRFSPVPPRAA